MGALLIVEDDEKQAQMLTRLLRSAGHTVVFVQDGPAALQSARERPPDLILLDLVMPGMDGSAFCQALSQYPKLAIVPIVVVSCTVADGRLIDRRGSPIEPPGVVACLAKPVDPKRLLAVVAQYCKPAIKDT